MANAAVPLAERSMLHRINIRGLHFADYANTSRVSLTDWALIAALLFEIPSLLLSQYPANSLHTAQSIGLAVLCYLLIRFMVVSSLRATAVCFAIGFGGAVASCFAAYQFLVEAMRLEDLGFKELVAFRSRLVHSMSGWVPGECFTVLLLALPFACGTAMYVHKRYPVRGGMSAGIAALPAILIVGGLVLSLSRAVFWSTAVFVVVGCSLMALYRVVTFKGALILLAGAGAALIAVLSVTTLLYPQVFRAYAGGHTSQLRSTQGRVEIWKRSVTIARAHPLWGIGSSNSALFLLSSADEEDTTGFASRPFSLPVQLLTEKGVIGFTLYGAFVVLLGFEFHTAMRLRPQVDGKTEAVRRNRKGKETRHQITFDAAAGRRAMNCCFAAGIVAVLCRELTYSSLLEHPLTLALFATLAALVHRTEALAA